MDPAVLGTLRIGLDAIDAEAHPRSPGRSVHRRRTGRSRIRVTLATLLRRAAEILEPGAGGIGAPEPG
jgi:hypothetical protein